MEDLEHAVIDKKARELGCLRALADLDQLGVAIALGELHQAEPVAIGVEAERLGIDGDGTAPVPAWRQIVLMQLDHHRFMFDWLKAEAPASGTGAVPKS